MALSMLKSITDAIKEITSMSLLSESSLSTLRPSCVIIRINGESDR